MLYAKTAGICGEAGWEQYLLAGETEKLPGQGGVEWLDKAEKRREIKPYGKI